MLTDSLLVALGVLLTAGTAVFVAGEFSLVTLDPAAVEAQTSDDPAGRRVRRALHTLSTQLSGAQVGITVTTVLLGYTTQPALGRLLEHALHGPVSATLATGLSVALALVLVNAFSMVVGELIPKNFALAAPLATAEAIAPFQLSFTTLFRPLIAVFNGSANWLLRRVGVEPREELSGSRSASELAALVRRSAEQGTLDRSTATLCDVYPASVTVSVYRPGLSPASVNEPTVPVVSEVALTAVGPPVAVTVARPRPLPSGASTRPVTVPAPPVSATASPVFDWPAVRSTTTVEGV